MNVSVECSEMVDTQVLIYATMTSGKHTKDPVIAAFHQTSLDLLRRLPAVRVSAIAWLEYQRRLRPDDTKKMADILKKVVVERVDAPIVEFAAELIRLRLGPEGMGCVRCLSTNRSEKCVKCGRVYSAQQRLNDALIVATGHVLATVDTLWSYDNGVIEMGRNASGCRVERPQSSTPLFDPEQNRALAAAAGAPNLTSVPMSSIGTPAKNDDE